MDARSVSIVYERIDSYGGREEKKGENFHTPNELISQKSVNNSKGTNWKKEPKNFKHKKMKKKEERVILLRPKSKKTSREKNAHRTDDGR